MVQVTLGGVTVGLAREVFLALLPVVLLAVGWFLLRDREGVTFTPRSRWILFGLRATVVTCLVLAAAGPYTVTVEERPGDPRVTMLVDESSSMDVFDADVDDLAAAIEAEGVPVRRATVGSGNRSRVGDGVVANVEADGSVLLVSDGRVTDGRSLEEAAEFARSVDATVSSVDLSTTATERYVSLAGPPKTSVGVENPFLVRVGGINPVGSVPVTVSVDGQEVRTDTVDGTGTVEFDYAFETTGTHLVTVRIGSDDGFAANDVYYRTVRVVDRPKVLYVTRGEYPLGNLLSDLYDVTRAESVPSDLSPYTAVVVQDVRAEDLGDVDALRQFVVDGNGLVVVGGENAFENGDYAESPVASLLPVQPGEAGFRGATVIITVDVSGSTVDGMTVQKALALDVLNQLDPDDRVGIVAFDSRAYLVAEPQPLGEARATLEDRIRRLVSGGGTRIAAGLEGAGTLLGDEGGNVVLLTDGLDTSGDVVAAARRLGDAGTRVVVVGAGPRIDERLLREVASESGGTYLRASETSRLRILFGDRPSATGGALAVVDSRHFITTGVETRATPGEANDVSVKQGADFLVVTGTGVPALSAWRFGLGRVVAVTAYGSDGTLDGLLDRPDSLLLSRSVNWAIGDPERKSTGLVSLADTRVGEPTTAVYVGAARPDVEGVRFAQVGPERFEATVVPDRAGFQTLLDSAYGVSYSAELAGFGQTAAVRDAVDVTGGRAFGPDDAAEIADFVKRQAAVVEQVREPRGWILLVIALVVYLVDVAVRRLQLLGRGEPMGER